MIEIIYRGFGIMMKIAFCGCSGINGPTDPEQKLMSVFENEFDGKAVEFFIGGFGFFGFIVQKCCLQYKKAHPDSRLIYAASHMDIPQKTDRSPGISVIDETVYIDESGIDDVSERIKWTVRNADLLIAYADQSYVGVSDIINYAVKINKRYIDLGSYEPKKQ